MKHDEEFVNKVQSILDQGNTMNKAAKILNVHHSKINRLFNNGFIELYTAFDEEEDRKHLYQNFEWLWEEDKLEDILFGVLDGNVVLPDSEDRDEDWLKVSKYVRDNYKNIVNYAVSKNKSIALESIFIRCIHCTKLKSLNDYHFKNNGGFLGLDGRCSTCCAKKTMKWYYENPEKAKESIKQWALNNPEKIKTYLKISIQKRMASKRSLPNTFRKKDLDYILYNFDNKCALTGSELDFHLDHVIPLSIGHGGTFLGNIIPLRSDLNLSKNNKNIFEWFEVNRQRFELSQERFDNLIEWLASANAMTVKEYRDYVYWCHDNPRTVDEINEENEKGRFN